MNKQLNQNKKSFDFAENFFPSSLFVSEQKRRQTKFMM